MVSPVISIVRCNLLISGVILKELSGIPWNNKYAIRCPALYTTSLISTLPPTFIVNKRIPYVLNFSEGNGVLVQNLIINFSIGNGLNYYLDYGLLVDFSIGNGLAANSIGTNSYLTDFAIGNGLLSTSGGTSTVTTNFSIGNGLSATSSTTTTTTTFTIG